MNEPIDFSLQGVDKIVYALNIKGKNNLLLKDIVISSNPTTYEVIDAILGERTEPQYCIHAIGNFVPSLLSEFTETDETLSLYQKIDLIPDNRIGTEFTIDALDNGSYIYFLTKADLEFYSNGFKGGFTKINNIINDAKEYNLYRSNQRLSRYIEIETKKAKKEEK